MKKKKKEGKKKIVRHHMATRPYWWVFPFSSLRKHMLLFLISKTNVYKKITCVTVNLITCIVFCVIYLLLTNSKNLQSLPSGIDGNGYALSHIFACLAQSRSKPYNGEHDKTFKKYKTLFMIMLLTWLPGMLFSDTQISHSPQLSKPLEKLWNKLYIAVSY